MIKKFNFRIIGLLYVEFNEEMYQEFLREMDTLVNYLESLPDNEGNDKLERIYFILDNLKEKKHKYKYMSIG